MPRPDSFSVPGVCKGREGFVEGREATYYLWKNLRAMRGGMHLDEKERIFSHADVKGGKTRQK
jgi:hypothetical protein